MQHRDSSLHHTTFHRLLILDQAREDQGNANQKNSPPFQYSRGEVGLGVEQASTVNAFSLVHLLICHSCSKQTYSIPYMGVRRLWMGTVFANPVVVHSVQQRISKGTGKQTEIRKPPQPVSIEGTKFSLPRRPQSSFTVQPQQLDKKSIDRMCALICRGTYPLLDNTIQVYRYDFWIDSEKQSCHT